jgi:hypothetical protein
MENRILVQTTLGKNWDSTWITTIVKKNNNKNKKGWRRGSSSTVPAHQVQSLEF